MKRGLPIELRKSLADLVRPRERLNVWQWAKKHVDYSRIPNYDTPFHGQYDPDFIPMWKEPAEALTDLSVREVAVVKSTRMGGSENAVLNPISFCISEKPQPILYLTGDQMSAERFLEKRVKRRLRASKRTAEALRDAQATQHDISFRTMDFRVSWPRSRHAFKQDGWAMVLCDETSIWPEYATDMARRRVDSYPFPHILFISSPDPMQKRNSDQDPIFMEWERGDKREWMCPDPAGGEFVFRMGGKDADGLRWDPEAKREDGTWDLEKVKKSAHYVTPGGAVILNEDRMKVARAGRWVPTATESAVPGCRSYRLNAFLSPFSAGDFGAIAVAFLKAKGSVNGLRAFVYEYLAEKHYEKKESVNDDELMSRCRDYVMAVPTAAPFMGKDREGSVFITVDVQKGHMWYVIREWWGSGDSALLDWGYAVEWQQIEELANKYKAVRVLPDCGYEERAIEVYEYAIEAKALPLRGSPSLKYMPVKENVVNPWEGKRGTGEDDRKIATYLFNADMFKQHLAVLMGGNARQAWAIPKDTPMAYFKQANSEERVDGEWKKKKGHPDNHIADCETMQVVGAYLHGLYRVLGHVEEADQEGDGHEN
jgi:hypothetical protein